MNLKEIVTWATFCLVACLASVANAAPIAWTLQGTLFNDGGTATGVFSVESTTGDILAWNITTTAGSVLQGFHYDTSSSSLFCQNCYGVNPNSFLLIRDNPIAEPFLNLSFNDVLTTPNTLRSFVGDAFECSDANCSATRHISTGTASSISIPEPTALALFAVGLVGFVSYWRRRAQ